MINSKKKGFTLVEMLVSVAISLFVFGVVIVGYLNFSSNREIRQKAHELKSQLRLVRSKAINGEKPNSSCVNLNGYRVYINPSFTSSLFYCPVCDNVCTGEEEINLGNEFQISSTESEFIFTAKEGAVVGEEIEITVAKGVDSYQLTVLTSGEIQVDEL